MRLGRAGLRRRALGDHRLAADQRRTIGDRVGRPDCRVDGFDVVAVDMRDDVPAIRFEPARRVVGEPTARLSVDRDAVVVVENRKLPQAPRAGKRTGFVRDAFHHAAVAGERVGAVVDDVVARPVEFRRQQPFAQGHPHRVGEPLAERPRRRFHPWRDTELRMSGRLRVQLAEVSQFVEREVVTGEVQQRVQQHRAVAVGEDETVAVRPLRVRGIVAQVPMPQGDRDLGHAHRHARMAAFRGLDGIHGERADRIGEQGIGDRCCCGHGGAVEGAGRGCGKCEWGIDGAPRRPRRGWQSCPTRAERTGPDNPKLSRAGGDCAIISASASGNRAESGSMPFRPCITGAGHFCFAWLLDLEGAIERDGKDGA